MIRLAIWDTSDVTEEQIRTTLSRIMGSRSFEGVARLKRFLEFVVNETLAGRGELLKEFAVGEYAFGKGASFDPRNDPIVRVQARRLRARLERYLQTEGHADEVCIEIPKGGYVPVFHRRDVIAPRKSAAALLLNRNSIVVLPFENQSADASAEELCRAISGNLTHVLTQIEDLAVRSATDVTETRPGHPANAAMMVKGSVQCSGDRIRITAQLQDTTSGTYLTSDSIDRMQSDSVFTLQDEIAGIVAGRIREGLSADWRRKKVAAASTNPAAQTFYLQGRYQLDQRTEESLRLSASLFERAIAEDGQFAEAHAGLADAYELMGHYGVIAPVEVWTKAPTSASMAVLLDEHCAEAHTALAHVRCTQDYDWTGSEHEFRRAIELDPRNATAHHWYATACLAPMGRLDEALESIQLAHTLAPLSSIISRDVASIRYYRREYDSALEQCDSAIELNPYFYQAYWTLGFIQEQRKDHVEALAAFSRALELAPDSPRSKGALGRMLALTGKKKQATTILKELKQLAEKRYVSPLLFASLHFALADEDAGYDWLRKAFQDRCFELLLVHVDPKFDVFRDNPIFTELSKQLGLFAANR